MRLNGWQRLWILLSLSWLSIISIAGYSTKPVGEFAPHHPAFIYQLAPSSRAMLASSDSSDTDHAVEVEMPNGYVLHFRPETIRDDQEQISRAYHRITVAAQETARSDHNRLYVLLAVVPCLIVLVVGFGAAWVRKGFTDTHRAEP